MACPLLADPRELFFNLTKLMCQRQNGGLEGPVFLLVTIDLRVLCGLRVTQSCPDPGNNFGIDAVYGALSLAIFVGQGRVIAARVLAAI
jgi:hypothetical protein